MPPYHFAFDSHPGPVGDAIRDAANLRRTLFLFIYSRDNPATTSVVSLLQQRTILEEIRENFIFFPLDVTWPEGWRIATELAFKYMPLIALVRPEGDSLGESQTFVTYEGRVSESSLLSSMRVEYHQRNPDAAVIHDQDAEYVRAVRIAEETAQHSQAVAAAVATRATEREIQRSQIDDEFRRIPEPADLGDTATIRFQYPYLPTQTQKFSREAAVRWLFVFVRKSMFPKRFVLLTGFPQTRIEESDRPLKDVVPEKQFIVYVEASDEDD
jgi:hypothetical protein